MKCSETNVDRRKDGKWIKKNAVLTVRSHEDRMSQTVTTGQAYKPCH